MLDGGDFLAGAIGGPDEKSGCIVFLLFLCGLAFTGIAVFILFAAYEAISQGKGFGAAATFAASSIPFWCMAYLCWHLCRKGSGRSEEKW